MVFLEKNPKSVDSYKPDYQNTSLSKDVLHNCHVELEWKIGMYIFIFFFFLDISKYPLFLLA